MDFWRGEPIEQKVKRSARARAYDLFNVHAVTETWLKKNLLLSLGVSLYTDLNNDISGSRIYGSDFDVGGVQNGLGTTAWMATPACTSMCWI
jgi:hypothetical protein